MDAISDVFLSTLPARGATRPSPTTPAAAGNFYPRSPRGERRLGRPPPWLEIDFYPRSPRGERRNHSALLTQGFHISIHAPREGSDRPAKAGQFSNHNFYPRSPRGERPGLFAVAFQAAQFLSTLPARGATPPEWLGQRFLDISIHAPREGSDVSIFLGGHLHAPISIHAPREGSDPSSRMARISMQLRFLSTLPARGATLRLSAAPAGRKYFYPRSPRGERLPDCWITWLILIDFYPRSPRGERPVRRGDPEFMRQFLSTLPARGATRWCWPTLQSCCHFYPRSPRGERPTSFVIIWYHKFISIHAPREGSDRFQDCAKRRKEVFLSTLPARGATQALKYTVKMSWISIHAPREGSDLGPGLGLRVLCEISIHAPREGSDPRPRLLQRLAFISIHAPREGSDTSFLLG